MIDTAARTRVRNYDLRSGAKSLSALVLLVSLRSAYLAQQPPCTVPVTVRTFDLSYLPKEVVDYAAAWKGTSHQHGAAKPGQLDLGERGRIPIEAWTVARDVPAGAFVARNETGVVPIVSVGIDRRPRRIVFVADNGKNISAGSRKGEVAVITEILSTARPQDSLALLVARGPDVALPLGTAREAIRAAVEQLASPTRPDTSGQGVLDAILKATSWLQPPQPGDAIFLMSAKLEGRHHASLAQVRTALSAGGIRVFGFLLDDVPTSAAIVPVEDWWLTPTYAAQDLSVASGGLIQDIRSAQDPLTDVGLEWMRRVAQEMYSAIIEYYALRFNSVGSHLRVDVSPQFQKGLLVPVDVLYPRNLPACSGRAGPKSEADGTTR